MESSTTAGADLEAMANDVANTDGAKVYVVRVFGV